MGILIGASLIAAFAAGIAALMAPCCITVLLPSYFASIFREKYKVYLMTFIFFLGVLTIFAPLGLGFAALSQFFSKFHNVIFIGGGIFLAVLGISLLIGKSFSMPFEVHPSLKKHNAISVYLLGIFSGIATTCCAPVLAGVMALSAMSGSIFWGMIYTITYVLGMVLPLFFIAIFLDKKDFTKKFSGFKRKVAYKIGSFEVKTTVSQVLAGTMFLVMGFITSYFAFINKSFTHSQLQLSVNIYTAKIVSNLNKFAGIIPNFIWALIILLIFTAIVVLAVNQFKKEKKYEETN